MENRRGGVYESALGTEVKEVDFFNGGRGFSTKNAHKGLLGGESGDSEVSASSTAREKRLSVMR